MFKRFTVAISIVMFFAAGQGLADDFNPKAGNYWTYQYGSYVFTSKVFACSQKVGGYSVLQMRNLQDTYGGGSYFATVPGKGICDVGVDIHDAMSGSYEGIGIYYPPQPIMGTVEYGDAVGTTGEWVGYHLIDEDDYVDLFDRDVWEVLGYEDVTVPYGTFVNAMKVLHSNYYTTASYDGDTPVPDEDYWEFVPSCSEYLWWAPCVGFIKMEDYEDGTAAELIDCKVNCAVVLDPTPTELSLTVTGNKLPSSVLYGSNTAISLTAEVANIDTKTCPAGQTVDIYFYLEKVGTGEKVPLGQLLQCSVANLAAGKSKKFTAKLSVPATVDIGGYYCGAQMGDKTDLFNEQVLSVQDPFVLLEVDVLKSNLPGSVVAGNGFKAKIILNISNLGNIATDKNEMAKVNINAISTSGGDPVPLGMFEYAVGNLKPSKSKKVNAVFVIPRETDPNIYDIEFALECDGITSQCQLPNPVEVAPGYIKLEIQDAGSKLPTSIIAGTAVKADIQLNITNTGNLSTSKTETANIEVMLRPIGDGTDLSLMAIERPIGNLKPSSSKKVKMPLTFDSSTPKGTYHVVACLDEAELVIGSPITIDEPSIDLAGSLVGAISPKIVVIGASSQVAFSLSLVNNGTTTTSKTQSISVAVYGRKQISDPYILLGEISGQNVGNLASGRSLQDSYAIPIVISDDLTSGSYDLVAHIDSQDVISEKNEDDNWIVLGTVDVEVIGSFMDLVMFGGDYDSMVRGNFYWGSGPATVSVYYDRDYYDDDYYVAEDISFANEDEGRQEYYWDSRADGIYLTGYYWKSGGWESFQFNFDCLVIPSNFTLKQKYSDSSPTSGYHHVYGVTIHTSGTAATQCEIVGIEKVTVNGIPYEAFKVNFVLDLNTAGQLDLRSDGDGLYNVTKQFKQTITWWAVPGTGIVKSNIKSNYKLTLSNGVGSETWSGTESRELIN